MSKAEIVLVHGGFVDGSGWQGVHGHLTEDGYDVTVVQNPTVSLADDVAATKRVIDAQDGPVVLVGHSYGGAVITEAGTHPNVAALVYIAAFAPDKGESVSTLIKDSAARRARAADPAAAGRLPLPRPGEVPCVVRRRRERRDRPRSWPTRRCRGAWRPLGGAISEPAWSSKPSWYLVATEDRMIPPPAQRDMSERAGATVVEAAGQPRDLRLAAGGGGRAHPQGGDGLEVVARRLRSGRASGPGRSRTCDLGIKSPLLYQLSYRPRGRF